MTPAALLEWAVAVGHPELGARLGGAGHGGGGALVRAEAPVTFIYITTWTVTTIIFQGTPETLAVVVNRFNSTNVVGLLHEPVRVIFLATCSGVGLFLVVRRRGIRDRVTWRQVVAARQPRPLPTWPAGRHGDADGSDTGVGVVA